jgi:hypothetical protein
VCKHSGAETQLRERANRRARQNHSENTNGPTERSRFPKGSNRVWPVTADKCLFFRDLESGICGGSQTNMICSSGDLRREPQLFTSIPMFPSLGCTGVDGWPPVAMKTCAISPVS